MGDDYRSDTEIIFGETANTVPRSANFSKYATSHNMTRGTVQQAIWT